MRNGVIEKRRRISNDFCNGNFPKEGRTLFGVFLAMIFFFSSANCSSDKFFLLFGNLAGVSRNSRRVECFYELFMLLCIATFLKISRLLFCRFCNESVEGMNNICVFGGCCDVYCR